MKDPRAEVYDLLKTQEKPELEQELRDYFFAMIGKDEALTNVEAVKTELTELQAKYNNDTAELEGLRNKPVDLNTVSRAEFDAVQNELKTTREGKANDLKKSNALELGTKLSDSIGSIDPNVKSAIVTALKSDDGYTIGGKKYKATFTDGAMLIDVDGESTTYDSGITSLMEGGVQDMVAATAGGGFPAFGKQEDEKALSFDDDINADMKKQH